MTRKRIVDPPEPTETDVKARTVFECAKECAIAVDRLVAEEMAFSEASSARLFLAVESLANSAARLSQFMYGASVEEP